MMRLVSAFAALALIGGAAEALAACRRYGTQLECQLGGSALSIGTQVAEPAYAGTLRPLPFSGAGSVLGDPARPTAPVRLELQNIGADPSLCRTIGNEVYCY